MNAKEEDSNFFFSVSGQKIKVNAFNAAQRSTTILREINIPITQKRLQDMIDDLINTENINAESINDYFKLQGDLNYQFNTQNLSDLCFLASYFQDQDLLQFLNKFTQEHFNTLEIVIQELKSYKINFDQNNYYLTYLNMLSDFVIDRIDDFLKDSQFEKVDSRLILNIFSNWEQKSNHKQFSHDLLWRFINQDLKNRHQLLAFIQMELLSKSICNEVIDQVFTAYQNKSKGKPYYYDDLKFPIVYLHNLKVGNQLNSQPSKSKASHSPAKIRKSTSDFSRPKQKSQSVENPKTKLSSEVKSSRLVENIDDHTNQNSKPDIISDDAEFDKIKMRMNSSNDIQQKPVIPSLKIDSNDESFDKITKKLNKSATSVRIDRDYTLMVRPSISTFLSKHRLSTVSSKLNNKEAIHFALEDQQPEIVRQILKSDPSKVNMKTILSIILFSWNFFTIFFMEFNYFICFNDIFFVFVSHDVFFFLRSYFMKFQYFSI